MIQVIRPDCCFSDDSYLHRCSPASTTERGDRHFVGCILTLGFGTSRDMGMMIAFKQAVWPLYHLVLTRNITMAKTAINLPDSLLDAKRFDETVARACSLYADIESEDLALNKAYQPLIADTPPTTRSTPSPIVSISPGRLAARGRPSSPTATSTKSVSGRSSAADRMPRRPRR